MPQRLIFNRSLAAAVAGAAAMAPAVLANDTSTFATFFDQAKPIFDVRYRYEGVDQAGLLEDANAHTLRVRGGFQTGKVWGLQGLVEFEGIAHLSDDFNDTTNGKATYPIVADPEDLQVNRLQLQFTGIPDTAITTGRQRINLDNQRFVGNVGWRQNEQTFDAVRVANTSIKGLTADYTFLWRANRVFGEGSAQGEWHGPSHLLNVAYDIAGVGKLTGYGYWLEFDDAPSQSSQTFGLRFTGKQVFDGWSLLYTGEFARQTDYANNSANFDLDYWALEGGVGAHGFKFLAGIEYLEGDGTTGFATPLATLHKFQGYADAFLTTPANGIVDVYGTLSYETKVDTEIGLTAVSAAVTYHDFETERGGASLGSEWDVEVTGKFGDRWTAGVKYANLDGDGPIADRDKIWVSVGFTY
jgi:hypothetical protein